MLQSSKHLSANAKLQLKTVEAYKNEGLLAEAHKANNQLSAFLSANVIVKHVKVGKGKVTHYATLNLLSGHLSPLCDKFTEANVTVTEKSDYICHKCVDSLKYSKAYENAVIEN